MNRHDGMMLRMCQEPNNLDLRLVYADWLEEEAGEPLRAELIRTQLAYSRMGEPPPLIKELLLVSRGPDYWEAHFHHHEEIKKPIVGMRIDVDGYNRHGTRFPRLHNLLIAKVFPFDGYEYRISLKRDELSVPFDRDRKDALKARYREILHSPAPGGWNPNPGNGWVWSGEDYHKMGTDIRWEYHNGFPDWVECEIDTWERYGPKLVANTPIVTLKITNPIIFRSGDNWACPGMVTITTDGIQDRLHVCNHPDLTRTFTTEEEAHEAYNSTALKWARELAGFGFTC